MKTLFENRQYSRVQANKIAESQKDLGRIGQKNLIIALGGTKDAKDYDDLIQQRIDAYDNLDDLSQFIVKTFLESDDIETLEADVTYITGSLISAVESIKE